MLENVLGVRRYSSWCKSLPRRPIIVGTSVRRPGRIYLPRTSAEAIAWDFPKHSPFPMPSTGNTVLFLIVSSTSPTMLRVAGASPQDFVDDAISQSSLSHTPTPEHRVSIDSVASCRFLVVSGTYFRTHQANLCSRLDLSSARSKDSGPSSIHPHHNLTMFEHCYLPSKLRT